MSSSKPESNTEISNIISKYNHIILRNISIENTLKYKKDKEILSKYITQHMNHITRIEDIINKYTKLYENILPFSSKIDKFQIKVMSSRYINYLNTSIGVSLRKYFLFPIDNFNYLLSNKSISVQLGKSHYNIYNIIDDVNRNKNYNLLSNESLIGFDYKHSLPSTSIYYRNMSIFTNDYDLIYTAKTEKHSLTDNIKSYSFNNKLKITKNFIPRPLLFRNYIQFDDIQSVSLYISQKNINNKINISTPFHIKSNIPNDDSVFTIGLEFKKKLLLKNNPNENNDNSEKIDFNANHQLNSLSNLINPFNITHLRGGIEYNHSINSKFLQFYSFFRKYIYLGQSFIWKMSIDAKQIIPICVNKKNNYLKFHETFHDNDFRGYDDYEITNKIGIMNNIKIYNKFYIRNASIFSGFSMEKDGFEIFPYIHLNSIFRSGLNWNYNKSGDDNKKNIHNVNLSAGLGISYISKYISADLYMTPFLIEVNNKNEIINRNSQSNRKIFGFSIGSE